MSENVEKVMVRVGGFVFTDANEAEQARKEAEGVRYIRQKTNMDKPEMVLQIYNKMIQQRLFETAVGFSYLKDLQDYLRSIPFIDNGDILPIPVLHPTLEAGYKERERELMKKKPQQGAKVVNLNYKKRYRAMQFVCGILVVCVIAMFVIAATSNNATILNYENEIINRYAEWDQELRERETALREREAALGQPTE